MEAKGRSRPIGRRCVRTLGLLGLLTVSWLLLSSVAAQAASADSWRFPLAGEWQVSLGFGAWSEAQQQFHWGEDVLRTEEVPVRAAANGRVVAADKLEGYGYTVIVEHQLPTGEMLCSLYGHLRQAGLATVGADVAEGETIGWLGANPEENGGWDFIHLHFAVFRGGFQEIPEFFSYGPESSRSLLWAPSEIVMAYQQLIPAVTRPEAGAAAVPVAGRLEIDWDLPVQPGPNWAKLCLLSKQGMTEVEAVCQGKTLLIWSRETLAHDCNYLWRIPAGAVQAVNNQQLSQELLVPVTTVTEPPGVELTTETPSLRSGETAILHVSSRGIRQPEYQIWLQDPRDESWRNLGDYASEPMVPFTAEVPGSYTLVAYAREAESPSSPVVGSRSLVVSIQAAPAVSNLTVEGPRGMVPVLTPVEFTARAVNPEGLTRYQFWKIDSSDWRVMREYSLENRLHAGLLPPGSYAVAVYALDQVDWAAGRWDRAYHRVCVVNVGSAVMLGCPAEVKSGTMVSVSAGSCGLNRAEYQFWVQAPDGGWRASGGYQPNANYQFVADQSGEWRVVVYAKDHYAPATAEYAVMDTRQLMVTI